jgi:hypothetical protein
VVEDPLEDHDLIDDSVHAAVVEELMEQHARPFFKTTPQRPHPSVFARAAG